ncbi:preprotein translocase subunit SecY [Patescibacteria group bacterium]|nr:preprotein translocase subunit SecY [Patescibacteria group bacterium]
MPPYLKSVVRFFSLPDLRQKFFIVIGLIIIARLISSIPIPGIDQSNLRNFLSSNPAFSLLNIFTGGGLINFSIALMGVGPYITSSIIFQLLTLVIPSLEALSKEGEFGRRKINQYTRIATIPLALIQGFGMLTYLRNAQILSQWTVWNLVYMLIITTAGTLLLMWIGELISEQGIGNGISIIITVGIISSFPTTLQQTYELYSSGVSSQQILQLVGFIALAVVALALIIFMNDGQRNIPVSYAKRVRGNKLYGGVDTHLPIKVNAAGVIPIIFAVSMVLFPTIIAQFLKQASSGNVKHAGDVLYNFFSNQWNYAIIYFLLVIAFTYFYTFIIFQPKQMAENLQKQGGFVPGVRPGNDTERYVYQVINRLTFVGAIFLAIIAVLPIIAQQVTKVQTINLGGTSLLIVVAVVLEVMRQVKAQLLTRTYDTYI